VDAHELVPGDLVRLYIGDRVPADIRIIETSDLKVGSTVDLEGRTDKAQQHTCALHSCKRSGVSKQYSESGAAWCCWPAAKRAGSLLTSMGATSHAS
jgi:Ca2+-transporting ATPase